MGCPLAESVHAELTNYLSLQGFLLGGATKPNCPGR